MKPFLGCRAAGRLWFHRIRGFFSDKDITHKITCWDLLRLHGNEPQAVCLRGNVTYRPGFEQHTKVVNTSDVSSKTYFCFISSIHWRVLNDIPSLKGLAEEE